MSFCPGLLLAERVVGDDENAEHDDRGNDEIAPTIPAHDLAIGTVAIATVRIDLQLHSVATLRFRKMWWPIFTTGMKSPSQYGMTTAGA